MSDFNAMDLSDDELSNLMYGDDEEQPAEEVETVEEPAEEEAPPASQEQEQTPEPEGEQAPIEQQTENRGNLNEALRQERERRRQVENLLQDPQALANYLAQQGYQVAPVQQQQQEVPDPDLEPGRYAQYLFEQQQQQIQSLMGYNQQLQEQAQRAQLAAQFPDLEERVSLVEQSIPDAHKYNIEEKYLMGLGIQLLNPQMRESLIKTEAQKLAQQMAAEALAKEKTSVRGPNGLSRAGSVPQGAEKPKVAREMSDDELYRKRMGLD